MSMIFFLYNLDELTLTNTFFLLKLFRFAITAKTLLHTSIMKFDINITGYLFTVTINNDI